MIRHPVSTTSRPRSRWRRHPLGALVLLPLLGAAPAVAKDWYVDPAQGSDSLDGTSSVFVSGTKGPWATITKACSMPKYAAPGDTIHVLPTAPLVSSASGHQASCHNAGTAGKPITIRGDGVYPHLTKLINDGTAQTVFIPGSYQTWTNFDIGTSAPVQTLHHTSPNMYDCIYTSPRGTVAEPAKAALSHIRIIGNVIHGCGGNGIVVFNTDYVTIFGNVIYGNAHTTSDDTYRSGITVLSAADSDSNTGTKIVIDSNTIYGNGNILHCDPSDAACMYKGDSDGNGIILDVNDLRHDTFKTGLYPLQYAPGYKGRMRIVNNVIFGNGGLCIHSYRTKHVDILNNTCYRNIQDPYFSGGHPAEIDATGGYTTMLAREPTLVNAPEYNGTNAMSGGDVRVANNSITVEGVAAPLHPKSRASVCIAFSFNVLPSSAVNNQCYRQTKSNAQTLVETGMPAGVTNTIDPSISGALFMPLQVVHASLLASVANFHPIPGSDLLGKGKNGIAPVTYDIDGVARDKTDSTLGAYEQ